MPEAKNTTGPAAQFLDAQPIKIYSDEFKQYIYTRAQVINLLDKYLQHSPDNLKIYNIKP